MSNHELDFNSSVNFDAYNDHSEELEYLESSTEKRITLSDWTGILAEFGYGSLHVIEFYLPDSPAREHFDQAWDFHRKEKCFG